MKLRNKIALITGGASGIGKTTASEMIREGATVIITDINKENGLNTAKELNCEYIFCDVTKEESVLLLIKDIQNKFQKLDILFNNAGYGDMGGTEEFTYERWKKVINTNLDSIFLLTKYSIPLIKKAGKGSIINCSSIMGNVGQPGAGAYSASKGGIITLTKSLALEYAGFNIRVNSISPGYIDTPMLSGLNNKMKNYLASLHPLGRLGKPEEVAKAVIFLASEDSSFITGTNIFVDGGYNCR